MKAMHRYYTVLLLGVWGRCSRLGARDLGVDILLPDRSTASLYSRKSDTHIESTKICPYHTVFHELIRLQITTCSGQFLASSKKTVKNTLIILATPEKSKSVLVCELRYF
jgi:hypothetical protein